MNAPRAERFLTFGIVALAFFFTASVMYLNLRQVMQQSPLIFDSIEITNGPDFCPGDTIRIVFKGRITRAPVVVRTVRNIYNPLTNNNTVGDNAPVWRTVWKVGEFINPDGFYVLPLTIRPGAYEYHVAAEAMSSRLATAHVGFTIRDDCGEP